MLRILLLLFLLGAIAECVTIYWLATSIGLWATLGLLVAAGILGAVLARRQKILVLGRLQSELEHDRLPADALLDGVLLLVAAVLLIVPGILSDFAAIILLLPPLRAGVKELLRRQFARRVKTSTFAAAYSNIPPPRDHIIDVEVVDTRSTDA